MSAPAHGNGRDQAALDFSREEAWVVHAALLAEIGQLTEEGEESTAECRLLQKLEAERPQFDADEVELIRGALNAYLADAPLRDRAPGRAALNSVQKSLPVG